MLKQLFSGIIFVIVLGLVAIASSELPIPRAELLSGEELRAYRGGDCGDQRCASQSCFGMDCNDPRTIYCSPIPGTLPLQCQKIAFNLFARCSSEEEDSEGYNCTEMAQAGCVTVTHGDSMMGMCMAVNCTISSGTCGTLSYSCTSMSCED